MVDLAEEVIESITPQGGRKGQSEKLLAATDLQSRIWVLVQRQYRVLWQHGALIFGHEVSEFVPPLGTRTRRGGKRDEAPVTPDSPSP